MRSDAKQYTIGRWKNKMVLIHFLYTKERNQYYGVAIDLETYTINSLSGDRIIINRAASACTSS